jgi:hypothetical protein
MTDRVVLSYVTFVIAVYIVITALEIRKDRRRDARAEKDHAAALALLEMGARAERDAIFEDMQQAAVYAQWTAFVGALPVLGYDPERLGGS